jgi:hypothetical protein
VCLSLLNHQAGGDLHTRRPQHCASASVDMDEDEGISHLHQYFQTVLQARQLLLRVTGASPASSMSFWAMDNGPARPLKLIKEFFIYKDCMTLTTYKKSILQYCNIGKNYETNYVRRFVSPTRGVERTNVSKDGSKRVHTERRESLRENTKLFKERKNA